MKESLPRKFLFVRAVTFDEALQVAICNETFYLFFEVEAFFGGVPIISVVSTVKVPVRSFVGG